MFEVTNFFDEVKRIEREGLYQRKFKSCGTNTGSIQLISLGCCLKNVNNAFVTEWQQYFDEDRQITIKNLSNLPKVREDLEYEAKRYKDRINREDPAKALLLQSLEEM